MSFNFVTAFTIGSDFGAQEIEICYCFRVFRFYTCTCICASPNHWAVHLKLRQQYKPTVQMIQRRNRKNPNSSFWDVRLRRLRETAREWQLGFTPTFNYKPQFFKETILCYSNHFKVYSPGAVLKSILWLEECSVWNILIRLNTDIDIGKKKMLKCSHKLEVWTWIQLFTH